MKILAALALGLAAVVPLENDPGVLDIDITGFDTPIHEAGSDLSVDLQITNPSSTSVESRIDLGLGSTVPPSRTALASWLTDAEKDFSELVTEELTLRPGTHTYTIEVPAASIPWGHTVGTWGPRGIEARVHLNDRSATDRSLLVVAPSFDLEPMKYTTIVPVTTRIGDLLALPDVADMIRSRLNGDDSASLKDALEDSASAAASTIDKLAIPGISLALDAALATEDLSTYDELARALDSFVSPATEVLLLPGLDANLAAWTTPLTDSLFEPSIDVMSAAQDTLAADGIASRTDVLVPPGPLTANLADRGRELNFSTVVGSSADAPLATEQYWTPSPTTHFASQGIDGVLADEELTDLLTSTTTDPGDLFDRQQHLLAATAVHYRERPNDSRPLVLMVGRTGLSDELIETLDVLHTAPWMEASTLSAISRGEADGAEREPLPYQSSVDGEALAREFSQVLQSETTIRHVAALTDQAEAYIDPVRQTSWSLTSYAWSTNTLQRGYTAGELVKLAEDLSEAITAEPSSTINIISQDTELPVRVSSKLPSDAVVNVRLTSSDRRLQFTETEAVLGAGSTTTVMVPVKAVGSGNVEVTIDVLDQNGNAIGTPAELDVRVRADWESMGTGVLAAFFVIILIIGIVRSAKKGTRTKPMDEVEAENKRLKEEQ